MAKNAEQLALQVKVKCRSTSHLILRSGTLLYNEDMQMVEIEFAKPQEELGPPMIIMKLSSISGVKAMDYIEGTRVNCAGTSRQPQIQLQSSGSPIPSQKLFELTTL
ncbi:hcp [Symbiodinium natans]|uniref:Hcp protein n=1 Tax=Symbiodinium natans TaxID=878477 RepID=A0A812J9K8_9DINO|nr:hcp [Symbiodinium natans]